MHRTMFQGILIVAVALIAVQAWAYPDFARGTKIACASCHMNPAGGVDLNDAGKAFKADQTKAPEAIAGADYSGVAKCKMCHMKQYKSWFGSKHAKAFGNLKSADAKAVEAMATALKVELKGSPAEAPECVKCHVTGYQLTGGYPAADSAKTAAVENVTCEACHGPGSKHASAPMAEKKKLINRAVSANMCMQCHIAATSPKFNYEEYKKLGVHTVAAAAAK